jgi:hypothetical protein
MDISGMVREWNRANPERPVRSCSVSQGEIWRVRIRMQRDKVGSIDEVFGVVVIC